MASSRTSTVAAVVLYTLLRVGLFALVWLTIELLTPISGIWAIVAGLLISGAISLIVLDRSRARVAAAAAGFFGGINARIDAATRAEDEDEDDAHGGQDSPAVLAADQDDDVSLRASGPVEASGDREQGPERDAVGE